MNIVSVKWYPEVATSKVKTGGAAAIQAAAELLLAKSREQVPLESGALSASGHVESNGLDATVAYGTPYACRWHEEQANFQNGRKNKYLEDPANDGSVHSEMLNELKNNLQF